MANELRAWLAGGCFWCLQADLDKIPGVLDTQAGFCGGHVENPSYWQVCMGKTGHVETVQVAFDPELLSYEALLDSFWRLVDPYDGQGQFCDKGKQYKCGLFANELQYTKAQIKLLELARVNPAQPVEIFLREFKTFYPASKRHQKYYQKSRLRYRLYRWLCGRDKRLKELWP